MNQKQRFEYAVAPATQNINEIAAEGWQLVETVERCGSTKKLIFERPLSENTENSDQ